MPKNNLIKSMLNKSEFGGINWASEIMKTINHKNVLARNNCFNLGTTGKYNFEFNNFWYSFIAIF